MIKSCKNPQKTVYMIFGLQTSCGGINEPLQAQRTQREELEREGYAFSQAKNAKMPKP
jgi:hypothetical protein